MMMASEEEKSTAVFSAMTTGVPQKTQINGMATIEDDDERLLAQIGYKQV